MIVIHFFLKAFGPVHPKQLEYFLRVAEIGSINRAASELRLSQPSLSRWLSILEREVGTPLLIRSRQGIRLSDAGAMLAERSGRILRELQMLRDDIGRKAITQVALAMPSSMQRLVTAPFAQQINVQQPHVRLHIYEGINNAVRRWMEQGQVDVAMMASTEHPPDSFSTTPLVSEELMLVGPRSANLRLDKPITLKQLGAADLILPGRPNVIRAHVEHALRRAGHELQSRFEAETLSLCMELTRRGLGHTIMPSCALQGAELSAELSLAPISNLRIIWCLHVNRARAHSTNVHAVAEALRAFQATQITSGRWRFAELTSRSAARQQDESKSLARRTASGRDIRPRGSSEQQAIASRVHRPR
jgi:LysR family transcriptional regulator, nitrogen assimilation regulatory protein